MGYSASANICYGIDLGLLVTVPEQWEDSLPDAIELLIEEFHVSLAGPKPEYPHRGGDQATWDAWKAQCEIGFASYGHEWSGTVITVGKSPCSAEQYDPEEIRVSAFGEPVNTAQLEDFLAFLETKGFEFHSDKTAHGWLLVVAYG